MDHFADLSKTIFAERIGGSFFENHKNIYKFEKIKLAKKQFIQQNPDKQLIDMGIGEPQQPTHPDIVKQLYEFAQQPSNQKYADNGCAEFSHAAASYLQKKFSITLDPTSEILHSIGSKSALSILPECFINQGDVVLMTTPGYGVFAAHTKFLNGIVHELPLSEENNFIPDFSKIDETILQRTKVLLLNYPNNPTGACATKELFLEAITLAKKYNFIVINDAAYSGLFYKNSAKLSIFNIEGAKDVALELYSLSKSYNMTGWRIGFVCGNERLLRAYSHVKSHSDSGQFLAIQKAAAYALLNQHTEIDSLIYETKANIIIQILSKFGFKFRNPQAGFFLYTRCPKSAKLNNKLKIFQSAEDFSIWLLSEFGICTVPWDECGHYTRLSMTFQNEDFVYSELKNRLNNLSFKW